MRFRSPCTLPLRPRLAFDHTSGSRLRAVLRCHLRVVNVDRRISWFLFIFRRLSCLVSLFPAFTYLPASLTCRKLTGDSLVHLHPPASRTSLPAPPTLNDLWTPTCTALPQSSVVPSARTHPSTPVAGGPDPSGRGRLLHGERLCCHQTGFHEGTGC